MQQSNVVGEFQLEYTIVPCPYVDTYLEILSFYSDSGAHEGYGVPG